MDGDFKFPPRHCGRYFEVYGATITPKFGSFVRPGVEAYHSSSGASYFVHYADARRHAIDNANEIIKMLSKQIRKARDVLAKANSLPLDYKEDPSDATP